VLESARIMKRRHDEVNTQRSRSSTTSWLVVAMLVLVGATSCGGRERRAERLWRQAQERVEKGDTPAAVALMQKLIDEYPDAAIADTARDQIVLYRGLQHAVESYPARRARDRMIQIARGIEGFRKDARRWPASLGELVPGKLSEMPVDPWNHPFEYQMSGRGYVLRCLGADGERGGAAEAEDILVVNGEFAAAAP